MWKYIKNGTAFLKGLLYFFVSKVSKKLSVGSKVRIFLTATIEKNPKGFLKIGAGAKLREHSVIGVRNNANLIIGKNVSVGMDNKIICHNRIEIGDGTLLSPNVLIYDHDHVFSCDTGVQRKEFKSAPVVIGKNCWIGANTVLLKGTVIGDNCVVGAGCVLKGTYADNSVIIQKRDTQIISKT